MEFPHAISKHHNIFGVSKKTKINKWKYEIKNGNTKSENRFTKLKNGNTKLENRFTESKNGNTKN